MKDPPRLLDQLAALQHEELGALRAGMGLEPTEAAKQAVWQDLSRRLYPPPQDPGGTGSSGGDPGSGADSPWDVGPVGGAAGAGSSGVSVAGSVASSHAASVTAASVLKSLALGMGIGAAATVGGQVAWEVGAAADTDPRATPVVSASLPSPRAPCLAVSASGQGRARVPAPVESQGDYLARRPDPMSGQPGVGVAAAPKALEPALRPAPEELSDVASTASAPVSDLREESRLIARARALLLARRSAEALELLRRARARFADGMLVQEREALVIEAMAQSGQHRAARQRATSFRRAYPSSPHVPACRRRLQPGAIADGPRAVPRLRSRARWLTSALASDSVALRRGWRRERGQCDLCCAGMRRTGLPDRDGDLLQCQQSHDRLDLRRHLVEDLRRSDGVGVS